MKKFLAFLTVLCVVLGAYAAWARMTAVMVGGSVSAAASSPEWFGLHVSPSGDITLGDPSWISNDDGVTWTSPGTTGDTYAVNSLGAYMKLSLAGQTVHMRCAIYLAADRSFVMQGASEITIPSDSYTWLEHTTFTEQDGDPIASPTLVGGTNYLLSCGADVYWGVMGLIASPTATDAHTRGAADYTGGFPAALPDGTPSGAGTVPPTIACQVTKQ